MSNIPLLDSGEMSLELINVFIPSFYEHLRSKDDSLQTLMLLYKNGNKKAGEIITYLMGTPQYLKPILIEGNQKTLNETNFRRPATFNISWSEPILNKDSDKMLVRFEVEAIFKDEVGEYYIDHYHLSYKYQCVLRKEFLEKSISAWLKEKGYKFRKSNPSKNKGALYGNRYIEFFGSKPNPDNSYNGLLCKHAKALYTFEVVGI